MEDVLHAVLLPWSAFGHLMPFFQLATSLAESGVHVTLVQTPRNIERLPDVPSHLKPLMTLLALPMPQLDKNIGALPNGAEATVDVPFEKLPLLKISYDLLQHPFEDLVAKQSPNWIIFDFMPHWVIDIAHKHSVPAMFFCVFSASSGAFFGPPEYLSGEGRVNVRPSMESLMSPPHWINFPSSMAYKKHEARDVFSGFYGPNGTEFSDAERTTKILNNCQAISIRTCSEFEGPYLDLFRKILHKPVIPTGFLPPKRPQPKVFNDEPWDEFFKWLDEQTPNSVVFVGFGSECKLSKEQMHEIAYGLELSGVPFIWALRKPNWANDEVDALPLGFGERTEGKGVVGFGWAPQMEILGHPSIGGSLFHSGWGSVVETLQFGHCLVVLPFIIDQGLNARLLVEKGLAIEIERGEDGSFKRDDIAKALRVAVVLEEGHGLRLNARKAAKELGDRKLHQEHYIGQLVKFMKSWNNNKEQL